MVRLRTKGHGVCLTLQSGGLQRGVLEHILGGTRKQLMGVRKIGKKILFHDKCAFILVQM
jgi:hypothetical protein